MIELEAQVVGTKEVTGFLASESERIRARVRRAVERSGIEVQRIVKAQYLSGWALNVRSGRLRRSITQETTDNGEVIRSRTGTNLVYARFWELGFSGVEQVQAHMRETRPGRGLRTMKIGGKRRQVVNIVPVRAHTRRVEQDARPFLRPALAVESFNIRERILRAMTPEVPGGST